MKNFLLALQMIGPIVSLVKQVESAIPGPKKGVTKLNLIMDAVGAAATASPDVASAISAKDLNATVAGITNAVVGTLNAAGVFTTAQ